MILEKAGFECEIKLDQMTSLINHFYWLHLGKPQDSKNQMVSVTFPRPLLRNDTPFGGKFGNILDKVDDFYRNAIVDSGVSDVMNCRAWMK